MIKDNVNHPVLTKSVELDLIIKAQGGDDKAMETLILHNIRYIFKLGMKYGVLSNYRHRTDDIFQEGVIGLMTAIRRFDVTCGLKLSTYSAHWIRQSITRPADRGDFQPFQQYSNGHGKMIWNICDVNSKVGGWDSFEDIWKSIVDKYGDDRPGYMTKPQCKRTYDFLTLGGIVAADGVMNEHEDGGMGESLMDQAEFSCFGDMGDNIHIDESMAELLLSMIGNLKPNHRDALYHRFGFNTTPKTLQEVGDMSGVTREMIRIREGQALEQLRKMMKNADLEFSDFIA